MPLLPMSRSRMKKGLNGIKINFVEVELSRLFGEA
jgi:hypothetical protein